MEIKIRKNKIKDIPYEKQFGKNGERITVCGNCHQDLFSQFDIKFNNKNSICYDCAIKEYSDKILIKMAEGCI